MIQLELRPEVEAKLTAEAKARGVEVEIYVESLIEEAISTTPLVQRRQPTAAEMRVFFEAMTANSENIPQLPDEAFERESFYRDHD
ncbi:MAG: hypothetical protein DMG65_17825 [Candidatus Angelobacter sp. Gp1-AA117]|nr:MAG: hypothetical protein DMG65_17825 [Candidatus Angelobacter sp. Gp1-AA117]